MENKARDDTNTDELLTSIAQRMAHSDKRNRDRALRNIRRWLARNGDGLPLDRADVAKLWRALFVCMWMSDKSLVQEQLAESISTLGDNFKNDDAAFLFLEEFLVMMAVKWNGIDKWRYDKYLMLVRKMIRQIYCRGASRNWSESFVSGLVAVLKNTVCKIEPPHLAKTPLGLKLHVADLFCEELAKVGVNEHLTPDVMVSLFRPYMEIVQKCKDSRFVFFVVKRVFDYLLKQSDAVIKHDIEAYYGVSTDNDEDGGAESDESGDEEMDESETVGSLGTALDPRAGGVNVDVPQLPVDYSRFHAEFLELAGSSEVKQSVRNLLFSLVKKFKDVANGIYPYPDYKKQMEADSIPRLGNQDYEEALKRMEEFNKKVYVDSGKNYSRKQKREDKKALKRLETETKIPRALKETSTAESKIPEKRKRVDKYAQMRSGKKHRKLSKLGSGKKKAKKFSAKS